MNRSRSFRFDGTAGTYFEPWLIGGLLTIFTLGIAYPWAYCRLQRWRMEHTFIDGRRLVFTGNGGELFGYWLKWSFLGIVTFGIYTFWAVPEFNKWVTERTDYESAQFNSNPFSEQAPSPGAFDRAGAGEAEGGIRDANPIG